MLNGRFARDRTSVIIGRGNYPAAGLVRLINITRGAQQFASMLAGLLPELPAERIAQIKREFQAGCGVYGADTAIGLVPNLVASRIANRLDLGGSAYVVDAACASALVAVDQGCRELSGGVADVVIAGGIHLCHDLAFWSVFSQLGALSRAQQIRPFDRRADGLLIGEGVGLLVLKRIADARRDDNRIYAVIRGAGVASDGRDASLMTPRVEGQVLALTRAWTAAGLDPVTIGLVEAHGTATVAGDAAELSTLARIFGPAPASGERVPLGSIKSMIGHAMPAAGAAGLIKAVLAVHHGVRPPTLHCEEPNQAIAATRFRTLPVAEPWDALVRRAAVNAFGFGGINAHVIVDACDSIHGATRIGIRAALARASRAARGQRTVAGGAGPHNGAVAAAAPPNSDSQAPSLVCAARTQAALTAALHARRGGGAGPWRIAVMDATPSRLEAAKAVIAAGHARAGRDGIYFSPAGLVTQGGMVAFLFPGVEAEFAPVVDDVAHLLGLAPPHIDSADLAFQGASVIALNAFMAEVAAAVGLRADVLAGHSIGEWSGMLEAGMLDGASVEQFITGWTPRMLAVADVSYVAVGAGAQRVRELFGGLHDVAVSHDNCPHQSILCAPDARVGEITGRLRAERILFEVLPFRSGFHSPALAENVDAYVDFLSGLEFAEARLPLWSATTCATYPTHRDGIMALYARHLAEPVRFRELVLAMYEHGVRVFVQVGSGSLAAFVDDILAGRPHHAVSLVASRRAGVDQLRRACAALYVEGVPIRLARVGIHDDNAAVRTGSEMSLELGVPLVDVDFSTLSTGLPLQSWPAEDPESPIAAAFDTTLRELLAAQTEVRRALGAAPRVEPIPERRDRIVVSVDAFPEILDHCLIEQPPGWPTLADRMPVVPMTMSVALMVEAANRLEPSRLPIGVENVAAHSWLLAEPAIEVDVVARGAGPGRIHVSIGTYIECDVIMADRYPVPAPPVEHDLGQLRPFPIDCGKIYPDGWMFHGPRYQGIVKVNAYGTKGLHGMLRVLPARGALLDAAGQLGGMWATVTTDQDRLVLPVRLRRIEYYGPPPESGEEIACTVVVRSLRKREVTVDLDMRRNGRPYAYVEGWVDWRFHTSGHIFEVMRQPALYLLADPDPGGFVLLRTGEWPSSICDFLARRFLSTAEIEARGGLRQLLRQVEWLCGRIAAKDAVRHWLLTAAGRRIFPVEIAIDSEPSGKPRVRGPFAQDLRISIAHKPGIACAIVDEGRNPGIDVERVEARGEGFATLAFGAEELALLPSGDRDDWLTRFWAAKEAAGKALGTGLSGDPKSLSVGAVEADRILVAGRWIATRRMGEYVVAWTVQ